jgi:hypothetical protein
MVNNWKQSALCKNDLMHHSWISYKKEEVDYAKNKCKECHVFNECLYNSLFIEKEFYGVNAGMSEYDFMTLTWVEVDSARKRNWTRNNRVLQGILQDQKKIIHT